MRILVALSGGIDSSVVAHLLQREGHELVGVRFALWSDPLAPALAQLLPNKCCNAQTAMRSQTVAKDLGIPFHVVDFQDDFKRVVVDRFLEEYRNGRTPNPCIACNREIKFGKLIELADSFGCEKIATGHYARVAREDMTDGTERLLLLEAVDEKKDQSYYLYGLSQAQLSRALFPLGAMQKSDVFALAEQFGIPFDEHYRESQDLCFFPEKSPHEFLKRHLADAMRPGAIVRRDGTVVGAHDGLPLYTYGQRRGLGIGGLTIPLEVVGKNAEQNQLIVSPKASEQTRELRVRELRWVSWVPSPNEDHAFESRTRSLSPRRSGTLRTSGSSGTFTFSAPVPPQSPGQSLVLYRGAEIVGGGVIDD
jgi:tRNA-specific 2-thiouridylase